MLKGKFESEELDIINNHLGTADVFVDVGANIGYYSCVALSLGKHAVAVEPQWLNLECLYANLSNNGWNNAEVFPIALSSEPGMLTLYGASSLCASLVKGWAGYTERFKQVIPVNTLDNILGERFQGRKLLIKIDVEGAEFDVLKGALKTLSMEPRPTWYIEVGLSLFHPDGWNPDFANTFELFWQRNYEVRSANKDNQLINKDYIEHLLATRGSSQRVYNFLFIPKE